MSLCSLCCSCTGLLSVPCIAKLLLSQDLLSRILLSPSFLPPPPEPRFKPFSDPSNKVSDLLQPLVGPQPYFWSYMLFPNLGISLSRSEGLFPLPLKLCRSLQLHWWYGFYPSLWLRTHILGTQPLYFREASATQRGHERLFHLIAPAEVPPHSHHSLPDRWGTFLTNDSCAQRLSHPGWCQQSRDELSLLSVISTCSLLSLF